MSAADSRVLAALARHARERPQACALHGPHAKLSYADTALRVARLAQELQYGTRILGLLLDNGPAWAVADLAAVHAGVVCVPLPAFFSDAQLAHTVRDAGVDTILTDQSQRLERLCGLRATTTARHAIAGTECRQLRVENATPPVVERGIAKITYTSGTTGQPKGVCLTQAAMEAVATSLLRIIGGKNVERHLCVLPLATLLENIGGIYVPLLAGTTVCLPPLTNIGLSGASALDPARLLSALQDYQASSAILIPQMLQALVDARRGGAPPPARLRYLAVGGAPVSPQLLARATSLGLPAHEGYGLSECASVVAVNVPDAHRLGSVGRPLPHVRVTFASDGEILVAGSLLRGYLGAAAKPIEEVFATGDTGYLDPDGFLHITGRKKNIFITSFGRNVSPEWVERELTLQPAIAQAAVYGEARPWNAAVVAVRAEANDADIESALREANRTLPDYAQVRAWVRADAPFSVANGQLTGTGRPRREAIWRVYGTRIDALYQSRISSRS